MNHAALDWRNHLCFCEELAPSKKSMEIWVTFLPTSHDRFVLGSLVKGLSGILNIVMIYPDIQFVYRFGAFRISKDTILYNNALNTLKISRWTWMFHLLDRMSCQRSAPDVVSYGNLDVRLTRKFEEYCDGLFQTEPWLMYDFILNCMQGVSSPILTLIKRGDIGDQPNWTSIVILFPFAASQNLGHCHTNQPISDVRWWSSF